LSGQFHGPLAWAVGALLAVMAAVRPKEQPGRRGWAVSLGAFALLWVAASWGGAAIAGSRSPLPPMQGVDVYRGHRAEASGVEPRRGDSDARRLWLRRDFAREAIRISGEPMTSAQTSAFWARKAAGEALRHPFAELKRTGVKILATYQGDPLPRDVSPEFLLERGETGALPISMWLGRIALPLGLAGLVLARRRAGWIVWIAALSGLLVALATFAEAEGRGLSVLGVAVGLALFLDRLLALRGAARLRTALGGVAAVAIFGFLPAFGGVPGQRIEADDYFQIGGIYDREKRGSAAMREYERALRMEPGNPLPRFAIAGMLIRDNVTEEAIRELESLREGNPDFLPGLAILARLYERQQRWAEASSVYGELIRLDPFNLEYLNNIGTIYVQLGFYDQAVQAFQSALAIDPNYESAQVNLAALQERGLAPGGGDAADPLRAAQEQILDFVRRGDSAAADSALQVAYDRFGRTTPDLIFVDATVHLVTGRAADAVPLFESVKARFAKNIIFLNNMAAAYAQSGRLAEAAATWEEALATQPTNERIRRSLAQVRAQMDSSAAPGGR
jgi:tetratricopeptide (TPR) repeat protein